jgi:HEAT repeat protein
MMPGSESSAAQTQPDQDVGDVLEPMTGSLLARLFGVPLLIISVIVGCAVLVVFLFGSIATDQQRSIGTLLTVLETHSGEKTVGVLLPNEKELWQVSRELAVRLSRKEAEISPEELEQVVDRLVSILVQETAVADNLTDMGRKRMHFVMSALALTESPRAVEPLAALLSNSDARTRSRALVSLAELDDVAGRRSVLPEVLTTLRDGDPVVRMTACVAISTMAEPHDGDAIEALSDAYLDDDRDVRWNAALALARLGSGKSRSLLFDMLNRKYWEDDVRIKSGSTSGTSNEYLLPPVAISRYLVAAIEASAHVEGAELWNRIEALVSDESAEVSEAARRVLVEHEQAADPKSMVGSQAGGSR